DVTVDALVAIDTDVEQEGARDDCLTLFGWARHDASAPSPTVCGPGRRERRRHGVAAIGALQNLRWTTMRMNAPASAAVTIANRLSAAAIPCIHRTKPPTTPPPTPSAMSVARP